MDIVRRSNSEQKTPTPKPEMNRSGIRVQRNKPLAAGRSKSRARSKPDWLKPRPVLFIAAAVLVVLALFMVGYRLYSSEQTVNPDSIDAIEQASMSFDPLMPQSNEHSNPDFRFDVERGVLSFNDQRNNTFLTISQQSASESVTSDPDELAKVTRHIQADNTIDTDKGKVYLASNENAAEQTAFFPTDKSLVFIHADKTLTFIEWRDYINELVAR